MKRLLCILSSLNAGGAETFLMKVYRTLPPDEYQFDFIVSEKGGCYTREVQERGGKVYQVPLRTKDAWGAFRQVKSVVKEGRYDCVLKLGSVSIAVVDLIAARVGGAKCLIMRSCNALTGLSLKQRLVHWLLRPVLNGVSNVKIAPSMLAAEFTFGRRQAHKNVHLLHNGVDLAVYHYDAEGRRRTREELSLEGKFVVGHIGRFAKQKNHRYLLQVFRAIREIREDAVLLMVGTGELEKETQNYAEELGLEPAVVFAGVRFDVPQILSAMDVFVFPSFYEGMPNTVIEAQSTGLPCVIADTITKEANITGLVRYLPLEMDPEAWAQTALAVAGEERRDTAQDFISHGYDIESVARELVELIGAPR